MTESKEQPLVKRAECNLMSGYQMGLCYIPPSDGLAEHSVRFGRHRTPVSGNFRPKRAIPRTAFRCTDTKPPRSAFCYRGRRVILARGTTYSYLEIAPD